MVMMVPSAFRFFQQTSGDRITRPHVTAHTPPDLPNLYAGRIQRQSLRVMTLNIAHGRYNSPNQRLRKNRIESNLDDIAVVLKREQPDILALQEADGSSLWSGKFNHVEYLAEKAGFSYSIRAEHVKGKKMSYGTALLSMVDLYDLMSVTFNPSPPTFSKGFVIATMAWPGKPPMEIDIVSVHLDCYRKSIRKRQIEDLITILSLRNKAMIIMGDFNCEWTTDESALHILAQQCNLKGYNPQGSEMDTFPFLKRRLDWVLVSPDLDFITYQVLSDTVSDHRGVICELQRSGSQTIWS